LRISLESCVLENTLEYGFICLYFEKIIFFTLGRWLGRTGTGIGESQSKAIKLFTEKNI
jgi:hypothetical protein